MEKGTVEYALSTQSWKPNDLLYEEIILRERIVHAHTMTWSVEIDPLVHDGILDWPLPSSDDVRHRSVVSEAGRMVYLDAGAIINLEITRRTLFLQVAANSQTEIETAIKSLRDKYPVANPTHDEIPVTFWVLGAQGPRSYERRLEAPHWADIKTNYPDATLEPLNRLIATPRPGRNGQLILWHGQPGTGKTYALRALLREWGKWLSGHYIIDTEAFFGGPAQYLMNVILNDEHDTYVLDEGDIPEKKWRLLVFEDAGELLSADAKERVGAGLSRLLNIVDGMIGQGLRILILITTNEEVGRMHPAVTRPGRTAANIRFDTFDMNTANEWLQEHGYEGNTGSSRTLADLYQMLDPENIPMPQPIAMGFSRRN